MLSTVVFTQGNKVISPILTTAREYGKWLETLYDEYTCQCELYLRRSVGDDIVLERHPGTRIGYYFDKTEFTDSKYISWYVHQSSTIMKKLHNLKLAEYKDIPQVMGGNKSGLRLLRLYSLDQIELYIRTRIDRDFNINNKFLLPKKIALRKSDMDSIIKPEIKRAKKSLLVDKPVPLTVKDIEKQLGYKVSIIS